MSYVSLSLSLSLGNLFRVHNTVQRLTPHTYRPPPGVEAMSDDTLSNPLEYPPETCCKSMFCRPSCLDSRTLHCHHPSLMRMLTLACIIFGTKPSPMSLRHATKPCTSTMDLVHRRFLGSQPCPNWWSGWAQKSAWATIAADLALQIDLNAWRLFNTLDRRRLAMHCSRDKWRMMNPCC